MTLAKALEILFKYYAIAMKSDYVHKPIAWAFHNAWREIDHEEGKEE